MRLLRCRMRILGMARLKVDSACDEPVVAMLGMARKGACALSTAAWEGVMRASLQTPEVTGVGK